MAKKKQTKVEEPIVEETVVVKEQPKVEAPKTKAKPSDIWEIKDRVYFLKGRQKPISRSIRSANIYWFDEEKGYERELKHTLNQRTSFVDEMKGDQRLDHIVFRSGSLFVPKEKTVLQKLLSLYHPHRDKLFEEYKPVAKAAQQVDLLELEVDALMAARDLDIDTAEAVMRVEMGSRVTQVSSKELKRDLLIFAKKNPILFLELAQDEIEMHGVYAVQLRKKYPALRKAWEKYKLIWNMVNDD